MSTDEDRHPTDPAWSQREFPFPWRQGRSVGRTIYNAREVLIGTMDTPDMAEVVVTAVNWWVDVEAKRLVDRLFEAAKEDPEP